MALVSDVCFPDGNIGRADQDGSGLVGFFGGRGYFPTGVPEFESCRFTGSGGGGFFRNLLGEILFGVEAMWRCMTSLSSGRFP